MESFEKKLRERGCERERGRNTPTQAPVCALGSRSRKTVNKEQPGWHAERRKEREKMRKRESERERARQREREGEGGRKSCPRHAKMSKLDKQQQRDADRGRKPSTVAIDYSSLENTRERGGG